MQGATGKLAKGYYEKGLLSFEHMMHDLIKHKNSVSIYFHIPFCEKRCPFCRFFSVSGIGNEEKSLFIASLRREVILVNNLINLKSLNIESVSIGGGTPFELSEFHLSKLLEMIEKYFKINTSQVIEYTIEINPHDIRDVSDFINKLKLLNKFNVNRLSFGVQSLDNLFLKINGSRHNSDDVEKCIQIARNYGFENINIDLMFGLVHQSKESWIDTLQRTISLHPEHISLFNLKIMQNCYDNKICKSFVISDTLSNKIEPSHFISIAKSYLDNNGYFEYYHKNFVYNITYAFKYEIGTFVHQQDVLGFGPGSITSANMYCYRNVRNISKYEFLVDKGILPIDNNNIYYPSDSFISRLAYLPDTY